MKQLLLTCAVIAFLLAGCSNGADKFIGVWKPLPKSPIPHKAILTIGKDGDHYTMLFNFEKENGPTRLEYDDKQDVLSGTFNRTLVTIKYEKSSGNIWFIPQTNVDAVAFQKIDQQAN